jgi:formate dehydrogenase iron-sulfur subunit
MGESMSNGPLQIKAISGHAGPWRDSTPRAITNVAKLIDVTTCIGCKACEVACLEWNGYPFRETVFDNTYQTMPDLEWNYYNLIRFNEHMSPRMARFNG